MKTGEKLICTVELETVPAGSTSPAECEPVLIEAESVKDASVQACRLALRQRREAVASGRALRSVRLWETPCFRVDVDGTLHRGSNGRLLLEWSIDHNCTLAETLERAKETALAL